MNDVADNICKVNYKGITSFIFIVSLCRFIGMELHLNTIMITNDDTIVVFIMHGIVKTLRSLLLNSMKIISGA